MILVTGVSGFIGKHLLKALLKEYGADKLLALTSAPITECAYLLHNNYCFDKDYFVTAGYDSIHTIIHAGAFTPKSGKEANNFKDCNSNISNTAKLLESDLPKLKKFIFFSTLDIYGPSEIITEQSVIAPVSLYGLSKYYCEQMVMAWAQSTSLIAQVLRVGHVYGPGEEKYQKIIPTSFKKIIEGKPVQLWGTGKETRAFIYIDDLVNAILQSLKLEAAAGPINLVSSQSISVKQLVDELILITGKEVVVELVPTASQARNLAFDNSKMRKLLLPTEIPLKEGLEKEWDYMKNIGA